MTPVLAGSEVFGIGGPCQKPTVAEWGVILNTKVDDDEEWTALILRLPSLAVTFFVRRSVCLASYTVLLTIKLNGMVTFRPRGGALNEITTFPASDDKGETIQQSCKTQLQQELAL